MAKKQSAVSKASSNRDALLKPKWSKPNVLSQKQRDVILALLTEGATLSEIFTIRGVASYGAFYHTRTQDAEFDALIRQSLAHGAEAALAEAAQVTRDAVDSLNPDDMRIAEAFHRCAVSYAEKVAPKDFGQLLKLGGADGGALTVQTVNFAPIIGGSLGKSPQIADASHARELDAEYTDLDPA